MTGLSNILVDVQIGLGGPGLLGLFAMTPRVVLTILGTNGQSLLGDQWAIPYQTWTEEIRSIFNAEMSGFK